jgi:hypothetical protein
MAHLIDPMDSLTMKFGNEFSIKELALICKELIMNPANAYMIDNLTATKAIFEDFKMIPVGNGCATVLRRLHHDEDGNGYYFTPAGHMVFVAGPRAKNVTPQAKRRYDAVMAAAAEAEAEAAEAEAEAEADAEA